jgi:hypothetical protein
VLEPLTIVAVLYGLGVLVGLLRTDAGPVVRISLALLWPLGPVAFAVTVAGLLLVAALTVPSIGVTVVAATTLYGLLTLW